MNATIHSVTDGRTDGRTDRRHHDTNSRSYCVAVGSAKKQHISLLFRFCVNAASNRLCRLSAELLKIRFFVWWFAPFVIFFCFCFCHRISTSEKGYMDIKMSVNTPGGHSSVPPSESSIGILAHAIARWVQWDTLQLCSYIWHDNDMF